MGLRKTSAQLVSAMSTWGLQTIFHRPAANMPGKIALKIDPKIMAELRNRCSEGSVMIVGTNGKTTITNMIADALELQGKSITCNRTGANLASGVATTLLQTKGTVDWGVFESDELWSAKILPQVKATYFLLLNLFRDQLDRCGEIDRIQDAIVSGLEQSPDTILIYNADDPLCATIAKRVENKSIAFGIGEDMHLKQNTVTDASMCQFCSGMFHYTYRHYGQLGTYTCPNCGFSRPALNYAAKNVVISNDVATNNKGISFDIEYDEQIAHITTPQTGIYMIYNLMAAYIVSNLAGVSDSVFQKSADKFNPQNGRLQELTIEGRKILLNLAKNPTGFNQNLKIITQDPGKKFVSFFINDNEADGHDISWIWDCDFEELASQDNIVVYAGGIRKNDLQMRLKHAGINAKLIDSVNEMVDDALQAPAQWSMYAIANYTSLPAVRSDLMNRADKPADKAIEGSAKSATAPLTAVTEGTKIFPSSKRPEFPALKDQEPLKIVHMFPDLLNLYGDGGNLKVLKNRCLWRGIPAEIVEVHYGEHIDLTTADIVFLGGGPDREQTLASSELLAMKQDITDYIENNGVLLAICGGYQILGRKWLLGDGSVEGLCVLDIETVRAGTGFNRLIENIALRSPLATYPVVGYENHAGRTNLAKGVEPFGSVISQVGHGNNDTSGADGAIYKNCIGTYLHGPLLGKNPEIADHLIAKALENKFGKPVELEPLDDHVELAANSYMAARLKAK